MEAVCSTFTALAWQVRHISQGSNVAVDPVDPVDIAEAATQTINRISTTVVYGQHYAQLTSQKGPFLQTVHTGSRGRSFFPVKEIADKTKPPKHGNHL